MMTQEQFIYWLRGFLSGKNYICTQEVELLREELAKVNVITFSNPTITPSTNPPWGPTYWGAPSTNPLWGPAYWGGPAGITSAGLVVQATDPTISSTINPNGRDAPTSKTE